MTHDPLFTARLLHEAKTLKAAVVYDFIPFEFPDLYLVDPMARHNYYTCLRWLSRFDLFMPISNSASNPLKSLLGIPDSRIVVTGAALDLVFATDVSASEPSHVLVIGGGDPRKNVECTIRAHAAAGAAQVAAIPLVITGQYSSTQISYFKELSSSLGGNPGLLHMPGHVKEEQLVRLYKEALCVIAPSKAEGFDLPVVEAMALGAAVLASDIPVHRELVESADHRFQVEDAATLANLISDIVTEPLVRKRIAAAQAPVWPRYRAAAVAERFWQPIMGHLAQLASPSILRKKRPRIALLSPVPPDRSGVADYTAATCLELGHMTELHVFTDTDLPGPVPGAASVRPLSGIPSISASFDRTVSIMGNSHFHKGIFDNLLRYGGACIGHDSRMLGFYRILLSVDRAAKVASLELGRVVSNSEIDRWLDDEATLETLHYGEIVAAADPMFVHSDFTAREINSRYGREAHVLPFCIYRPWEAVTASARTAARQRLKLPKDEVVIATFGFVHRTKAPAECIWALEILRGRNINASLHFVGTAEGSTELRDLATQLGLQKHVRFLGSYVSNDMYRDYLLAADLGIQLRMIYFGSLSGALLDCVAAGLPTVANASLADAMEAPNYVRRVPDMLSPLLIAEALHDLIDAGLTYTRPELARKEFSNDHSFRTYAVKLCEGLDLEIGS